MMGLQTGMRGLYLLLVVIAVLLAVAGCGRGGSRLAFGDVAATTEEALTDVLLGVPPERALTMTAPPDKPLLKLGVYDSVYIAADAKGFAEISRGAISESDIVALEQRVVEQVDRNLKRRGFRAERGTFPMGGIDRDRVLIATLTPTTQEGGSPQDRAENRGTTYVLVRLTVTDPKTRTVLARRDYFSGHEMRGPGDSRRRR